MKDNLTPKMRAENQKEKARERQRRSAPDDVEIIPGKEQKSIFDDDTHKRVGIYVRVSTDDPHQTSSYELQKSYYEDFVKKHSYWELVEIYADEGISGTSLRNRDNFKRMIEDCEKGLIDLVVVKSVSRFARNIVDCLAHVRKLAALRPAIGIYFEIDNIYTLNPNSEMNLNFVSMIAQEESHMKSKLLTDAYRKRARYGIVWTPELLGYDLDEDGNLMINEEEAKTIRLIYFMYLYGYTCVKIAETLMELGRRTNQRNPDTGEYNLKWSAGTVLMILQNERHCGELLTQKTFKPSYLDHKVYKNRGELPQHRKRNHHDPIISRDDFVAVQRLISNAKYGNKGVLPELKVITEGALSGFVSLNPRWAAFSADDYGAASQSAYNENNTQYDGSVEVKARSGEFDLRGYEVVRSQFFNTSRKKCITFSTEHLWFSSECLSKLNNTMSIEILINPTEQLLAVRPCTKEYRNAVRWAKIEGDKYRARQIMGAAFLRTLYDIFGWNIDLRYRVRGVRRQKGEESILIFDMKETEIFIPTNIIEGGMSGPESSILSVKSGVTAYPQAWTDNFGQEYYRQLQARELAAIDKYGKWAITKECQPYRDATSLNVTSEAALAGNIKSIMSDMEQGDANEGS